MTAQSLSPEALIDGFRELSALSAKEYKRDLSELLKHGSDKDEVMSSVGRLVGVILKQPLSNEIPLSAPSQVTGAYYTYSLDPQKVDKVRESRVWQLAVYNEFLEGDRSGENRWDGDLSQMVINLQAERSFWFYLVRSLRKYICNNKSLKAKIKSQEADLRRHLPPGSNLALAPHAVISASSYPLATTLVASVPVLASASPIVIAGIVAVIATITVDAFCDYSDQAMFKSDKLYEADKQGT
jgi:hypothetical protein